MHLKNKTSVTFLSSIGITLFVLAIFVIQINSSTEPNFLFLTVFLALLITTGDLIGKTTGIYGASLWIILLIFHSFSRPGNKEVYSPIIVGQIIILCFYLLLRKLKKQKLESTSKSEAHFRTLVNTSLQPVIVANENAEVVFASKSLKEFLNLPKNVPSGKNIAHLIHPEDIHLYNNFLTQVLKKPNSKKHVELRLKRNEFGWAWIRVDATNLLKRKNINALVISLQDITFQKNNDFYKTQLLSNERGARALAEKAVRDRDEFLSIASHELKTPLTTVILQLQANLRKILTQSLADFSGRELLDSLQIAERQSQSLSTLIKDLLNVSLASSGRLTLNKEKMSLSNLISSIPKRYEEEIRLSGCYVETNVGTIEIFGDWDPVRLDQAVTNLFMNALKYAKGKKIILSTKKDGDFGVLEVQDFGPGIQLDLQKQIFEPFKQGNGNSQAQGLGVGLFIAKQIATAHDGSLSVESQPEKGATFTLRLPLMSKTS